MPYIGGSDDKEQLENMRLAFTCPMVKEEIEKLKGNRYDGDGDGKKDEIRFPYHSTHARVTTYNLFVNYKYSEAPMRLLGEPWKATKREVRKHLPDFDMKDTWSYIMGSDQAEIKFGGRRRVNHYPIDGKSYVDREWRGKDYNKPKKYRGWAQTANGGGSGWYSVGPTFSFNYLFSDGSVVVRNGLRWDSVVKGARYVIPKEYYQEGR